ncbi:uncharacterized protein LOC116251392 [Nymphaea colorata]|nr:uncharacterized protein LOC116251392 [Nymphaea colorata]
MLVDLIWFWCLSSLWTRRGFPRPSHHENFDQIRSFSLVFSRPLAREKEEPDKKRRVLKAWIPDTLTIPSLIPLKVITKGLLLWRLPSTQLRHRGVIEGVSKDASQCSVAAA